MKKFIYIFFLALAADVILKFTSLISTHYIRFSTFTVAHILLGVGFIALGIYIFIAWYRHMPNAIPLTKWHIYCKLFGFFGWLILILTTGNIPSIINCFSVCSRMVIELIMLIGLYCSPYFREIYPREQRHLYFADKIVIASVLIIYFTLIIIDSVTKHAI